MDITDVDVIRCFGYEPKDYSQVLRRLKANASAKGYCLLCLWSGELFLQVCPILCVDLDICSDSFGVDRNEIEKPDWVRRI